MASKVVKYVCPNKKTGRQLWADVSYLNVFQVHWTTENRKPLLIVTYAEGATQVSQARLEKLGVTVQ